VVVAVSYDDDLLRQACVCRRRVRFVVTRIQFRIYLLQRALRAGATRRLVTRILGWGAS
jgi:hypothetical protein